VKKYLLLFICLFLCSYGFSQGTIASCTVLYPEESVKDQLLLCNRTTKISLESPACFRFEVTLDVINMSKDDLNCNLIYSQYLGVYDREHSENDISVYVNNNKLVLKEKGDKEAIDFIYECVIPKGFSTITYVIVDGGTCIERFTQGSVEYWNITKWNLAEGFLNKYYINIYNQTISVDDTKFKMLGTGKEEVEDNINYFHLKSGTLYYESNNLKEYIHIETPQDGKYRYFVNGSGAPVVSKMPSDPSCYFYVYQFLSASKIIGDTLRYGFYGDTGKYDEYYVQRVNGFVEMLKTYDKQQLRLLRNAFFAIHDYAFKDPELLSFFSSSLDYFPDENVTQDSIEKQKSDEIVLEMIQALENDKSVDDVVRKYLW